MYPGYTLQQDETAARVLSEADMPPGPDRPIAACNTLTVSDKALVKQAFGYDMNEDPLGLYAPQGASELIGRLNLDRSAGDLTGPVTVSYLQSLVGQTGISADVIAEAEKALSQSPQPQ
jgi:hypothetical protein